MQLDYQKVGTGHRRFRCPRAGNGQNPIFQVDPPVSRIWFNDRPHWSDVTQYPHLVSRRNAPIKSNRDFHVIHRICAWVLNDSFVAASCASCNSALGTNLTATENQHPSDKSGLTVAGKGRCIANPRRVAAYYPQRAVEDPTPPAR